jgi:hypothetical protein
LEEFFPLELFELGCLHQLIDLSSSLILGIVGLGGLGYRFVGFNCAVFVEKIVSAEVGNEKREDYGDTGDIVIEPDAVGVSDAGHFQDEKDSEDDPHRQLL